MRACACVRAWGVRVSVARLMPFAAGFLTAPRVYNVWACVRFYTVEVFGQLVKLLVVEVQIPGHVHSLASHPCL